jgi:hypothetical protein
MKVTHKGIYVMARIGSFFCIEGMCQQGSTWDTRFQLTPSLAMILIKYGSGANPKMEIVEVDSKSWASLNIRLGFIPSKFFISKTS